MKCPSCGSLNVEQIDFKKYQCPYCGTTFSEQEEHKTNPKTCTIENNVESKKNEEPQIKYGLFVKVLLTLYIIGYALLFIGNFMTDLSVNWFYFITSLTMGIATWLILKFEKTGIWLLLTATIIEVTGSMFYNFYEDELYSTLEPIISLGIIYAILQIKKNGIKYWNILEYKLKIPYRLLMILTPILLFVIGIGITEYEDISYYLSNNENDYEDVCYEDTIQADYEEEEYSADVNVESDDIEETDEFIRKELEKWLLGENSQVVLSTDALYELRDSSWPELQCPPDCPETCGSLFSPSEGTELNVSRIGEWEYQYSVICPCGCNKRAYDDVTIHAVALADGKVEISKLTFNYQ